MTRTKLATVSMNVQYNKQANLAAYNHYIEQAALSGVQLIVFPEQSVQGYLRHLNTSITPEDVKYQYDNAETVPRGPITEMMIGAAQKHNTYVVFGLTEQDPNYCDILYNTAVLVGPEGYIGHYRKVHQPGDEVHVYYPGNEFPVFTTEIGKIGLLICYDKCFPEVCRELTLKGAEILVMPTAWAMDHVGADPKQDSMGDLYNLYDRVRACENGTFFISSNQFGVCGDSDYFGHSQIVGPKGDIRATTGYREGLAFAEVDVRNELIEARAMNITSIHWKRRQPDKYTMLNTTR